MSFSDPDRYKQVFLDYFNNKLTPEDIAFVTAEEARNNQFNDSEKDKQVQINNVNDLTDAQIEDLSLFAAHLINGLRNQLGLPDVTVTKGSIKFAKDVAQKYISDLNAHRWSDGLTITQNGDETDMDTHGWHNIAGINNDNIQLKKDTKMDKMPRARRIFVLHSEHPELVESHIMNICEMLKFGFGRWNLCVTIHP